MTLADAAQFYVVLSVGDGLVAQIPSLLLSIATAIIVTRVSASQAMAEHIGEEIGISRAWYPVAVVIGIIGLVPGMPTGLFMAFAVTAAAIGFLINRRSRNAEEGSDDFDTLESDSDDSPGVVSADQIADTARISIILSYPLISLVEDEINGPLVTRVSGIRKEISKSLGFVIPSVRIKDDLNLQPNFYQIKIGQYNNE